MVEIVCLVFLESVRAILARRAGSLRVHACHSKITAGDLKFCAANLHNDINKI